jgi:NADH-quinone oxidoreductase subunit N
MTLDFSSDSHLFLALMPEIVLAVWGMVVLLAGVWRTPADEIERAQRARDLGWLALAGVVLAALANGWLYGIAETTSSGAIALDGFRLFANWIFLAGTGLAILISFSYVEKQRFQAGEFYALILFATLGMMVMGGTRDLILIFLGLEVMSIAAYVLTAYNRRDRRSAEAGLKYFLMGAFSTGFFLYGIALVYGATGSTNIATIADAVAGGAAGSGLLMVGIALLAIGFGFKVSAVPFHMWTPDVYEGAPSPVTAFMSAGVKAAAFVAFMRVFLVAFEGVYESWYPILWWLAALTMVLANLVALAQTNVKRMLAYSSIAHAGYLLVAIVAANQTAAGGLLFYLLIYTVMNMGAFAVVMLVADHGEGRLQIEEYAGFGWRQPLLGIFFTIFLLSLAGFPFTGGFIGKIFLLQAAAESQLWTLAVILVLTTVLSYFYYLRVAWFMWMRDAPSTQPERLIFTPIGMRIALFAGAGAVLVLGIFPGAVVTFARLSVEGLTVTGLGLSSLLP